MPFPPRRKRRLCRQARINALVDALRARSSWLGFRSDQPDGEGTEVVLMTWVQDRANVAYHEGSYHWSPAAIFASLRRWRGWLAELEVERGVKPYMPSDRVWEDDQLSLSGVENRCSIPSSKGMRIAVPGFTGILHDSSCPKRPYLVRVYNRFTDKREELGYFSSLDEAAGVRDARKAELKALAAKGSVA